MSIFGFLKKARIFFFHFKKKNHSFADRHNLKLLNDNSGSRIPSFRQFLFFKKILNPFEKKVFNISLLVFIVSTAWLTILILDNYRVQIPNIGGSYSEGLVGSLQLINPLYSSINDTDADLTKLIFSGLMRYDKNQNLVPDLAVRYEISEDKKVYTFELRRDVVWHDKEPFTAKDVFFTFDLMQDEMVESPLLVSFKGIVVEQIDDYTINFTLPEQFRGFLSSLTVGILPEHIWAEVPFDQVKLAKRNLQPIGTGPFKFKRLLKDNLGFIYSCELERFDEYYRQPPFIGEFIFDFFADYESPSGVISAIREQKIDGLSFVPRNLSDKVQRKHIKLNTLQLPQYTALFVNQQKNTKLADKDLRLALSYALDKNRILNESIGGEGKVIHTPILPNFPGFDENSFQTKYSVDEANELLDKKWTQQNYEEYKKEIEEKIKKEFLDERKNNVAEQSIDDSKSSDDESKEDVVEEIDVDEKVDEEIKSDDELSEEEKKQIEQAVSEKLSDTQLFYRKNKDGEALEINLVTVNTNEYRLVAELVVGYWQEIGIKTNITFVEPKELTRKIIKTRDYDVLLYGIILGGDHDQYIFWHSSQVNYPGLNLSGYNNTDVDAILEKNREIIDDDNEELIENYKKLQEFLSADVPTIFLYTPTYTYALSTKVQGFDVSKISHPSDRFANVVDWYVNTKGVWEFKK